MARKMLNIFAAALLAVGAEANGICMLRDEVQLRVTSQGGSRFELFDHDDARPTVGALAGPEDSLCVKAATCTKLNVFAADASSVTVSDGRGNAKECRHHECYFHVCASETGVSSLSVRTLDSVMEHPMMSEEDFELPTLKHASEKKAGAPPKADQVAGVDRMRKMFEQVRNLQGVQYSYQFDTNCVSSGAACGEDAHCPPDEFCYIPTSRKKRRGLSGEDEEDVEPEHGRKIKFGSNVGGTCLCT